MSLALEASLHADAQPEPAPLFPARLSLDGTWNFLHAANDRAHPIEIRSIEVPGPWQAQFTDLRMRAGTGIYARTIEVPSGWIRDRVFLRFGAVFHNTQVWVNGTLVSAHEGGFLPFCFDVTEQLQEGINEVKVRVESPTDDPAEFPDTPFAEIPFGKQSWYGPLSGIWQTVFLERRIAEHIQRFKIMPELETGRVRVRIVFARTLADRMEIETQVTGPDGNLVVRISETAECGIDEMGTELMVPDVKAWSPDEPHLYRMTVRLKRHGEVIDELTEAFGYRTIETRDGKLYLNGRPIYLRAALDQDYYPDLICTVPSMEFLEDQFRKAKELGLNCLRCHIKAADPRYYEAADRIGLLIWTELPNGGLSTERSRARKEATLKGIVDRDGNHPSIVIWTIINENWGVDLVHDGDHRAWLKRTYHWLKAYDPTRLVVDNSPLAPSFHVETDIADYHFYAAFPDSRADWDTFVEELASRSGWLFSSEGDAVIKGDEPLMCSEFGNWGLPHPEDLRDAQGREPWWFETGHDWGEGVMYAHGIENRFTDWSLDRVFGSLRGFVEAAQWQQFRALKYEIETMRRKETLAGYVITEFTDCHWESNGLLDMRRNPRVFHDVFGMINADTVIAPRWERLSYWSGETARFAVSVAHGAGETIEGASLEVGLGAKRLVPLPTIEPATVADLGTIEVAIPEEERATLGRLNLSLRSADGQVIATNALHMAIHPRRLPPRVDDIWSPSPEIRRYLSALGYGISQKVGDANLVVALRHDEALANHTRLGGRLLLLPQAEMSLNPLFPHWQNVRVLARDGTLWRGDWASTFAWLRRMGVFAGLPGGPLIDETFDRVLPRHVIANCNLLDFQARVHAGMVIGWIHKPVALAVERAYGKGRFVASTFRLFRDEPGKDPTATALIDALIRLALAEGSAASRLHGETRAGAG